MDLTPFFANPEIYKNLWSNAPHIYIISLVKPPVNNKLCYHLRTTTYYLLSIPNRQPLGKHNLKNRNDPIFFLREQIPNSKLSVPKE